jgi:hypothetical protein
MGPWHRYVRQAQATCSPLLGTVIAAQMSELRPPSRRGANLIAAADARAGGWWQNRRTQPVPATRRDRRFDHRHIPQYLPAGWLERHFNSLIGLDEPTLRRSAAIRLIQMTQPLSVSAAATLLGIPPGISHAATFRLGRWTRADPANYLGFTAALDALADELDTAAALTDYARRREALATWTIPPADWTTLITGLKPQSRAAIWGDRKRRTASVLLWMHITEGEHRLAPLIRNNRTTAGTTTTQLALDVQQACYQRRAHPEGHYAALTSQLIPYAERLTADIDSHT